MHTYAQVFYTPVPDRVALPAAEWSIDEWHVTPAELMTLDGHTTLDGQPQCSHSA